MKITMRQIGPGMIQQMQSQFNSKNEEFAIEKPINKQPQITEKQSTLPLASPTNPNNSNFDRKNEEEGWDSWE